MPYEDLTITTSDGLQLKGWFLKQRQPTNSETLIYFHENAGNIGNRLYALEVLYFELEVNIVIVGYRGYGHSEGVPSEEGLARDAEAIMEWVMQCSQIKKEWVFVIGKSLGGAVAVQMA